MFATSPEIAVICVASGVFLIARGLEALFHKSIKIRKHAGWPWIYDDVTLKQNPRLFLVTALGNIALGIFFVLFPFAIHYLY